MFVLYVSATHRYVAFGYYFKADELNLFSLNALLCVGEKHPSSVAKMLLGNEQCAIKVKFGATKLGGNAAKGRQKTTGIVVRMEYQNSLELCNSKCAT